MTLAQRNQYADFLPKQLYIPSSEWPKHDSSLALDPAVEKAQAGFFAAYDAAKATPDVAAGLAWDPAMLIVDAIRKLGPTATAAQLRDHLAKLQGFAGINGVYDFSKVPQRGLDERDAVVTRWSPTQKVWEVVSKPTGIPLER
jgi:branched-chain amino acid transport system substrate-binding protein